MSEQVDLETKKRVLGQFFTKNPSWLKPQIISFIQSSRASIAVDPFAGTGDLLKAVESFVGSVRGYDLDPALGWEVNDSLLHIPSITGGLIVTNPPYLTNFSAKRKGIYGSVQSYFESKNYVDLYQLALDRALSSYQFVVAIIPESFINSSFPKNRARSITILEESLFDDTDCPTCVVCFDGKYKSKDEVMLYKGDILIGSLGGVEAHRLSPQHTVSIRFNATDGNVAIRAIDMPDPTKRISFLEVRDLNYALSGIKNSSRLITIADIPVEKGQMRVFLNECNKLLSDLREKTGDLLFTPFKGNNKLGVRRRRLDYGIARAIMEQAYTKVGSPSGKKNVQRVLV